jgi:hypothetical protein
MVESIQGTSAGGRAASTMAVGRRWVLAEMFVLSKVGGEGGGVGNRGPGGPRRTAGWSLYGWLAGGHP